MIRCGIDYSLNSTGVCIYKDNTYHLYVFFNGEGNWDKSKSKKWSVFQSIGDVVGMVPYTRHKRVDDYKVNEQNKLIDATYISHLIVNKIKEVCGDEQPVIGIEGFSFNSMSNSSFDLCEFQSILRYKLCEVYGVEYINIIPPTEIKKQFSGKGNTDKMSMIDVFKSKKQYENTGLYRWLNDNELDERYLHPIEDLVDSVAIIDCI